jgi:hypothetical protein
MPQLSLAEAAAQTGLAAEAIRDLAHTLVENRPVLAVAADGKPAVAALNVLLDAVGAPGGIVRKNADVQPHVPAVTAPGSARAVLIDATVPWEFAPATDAEVFRFAAWDGGGNNAGWLLPAPGFLEELTDVPTPPTSARETYAVAMNLTAPAAGAQSAAQFLLQIDSSSPAVEKVIDARCEQIFRGRQGSVYGDRPIAVASIDTAAHLKEQLRNGAVWMGEAPASGKFRCELKAWPTENSASPVRSWAEAWAPPLLPALATKLYQESNLRAAPVGRQA